MKGRRSRMILSSTRAALMAALAAVLVFGSGVEPSAGQNAPPPGPIKELDGSVTRTLQALEATGTEDPADPAPGDAPADESEEALIAHAEEAEVPLDIQISPQGRVEMHVRDAPLSAVLQMFSIRSQRNIVASKNVEGKVTADLYAVTFEEALTAILASNACGWREEGQFIFVHTLDELAAIEAARRGTVSRLFRLHYARAEDVEVMVQPLLSEYGQLAITPQATTGLSTSAEEAGGDSYSMDDSILVVDYPENVELVANLIKEIDVRPRQVLIEATILLAELTEENALGIDFDVVGGIDFEGLSSTSNGAVNLTKGQVPMEQFRRTTVATELNYGSTVTDPGFTFGIIKNNISLFIHALDQVTDTTVLANPKVLALDKQRGEVIVGRRDGYLTTTVTETAAVQNVEFLETGTQLIFRPFIGDDGYIRMEIHPEDSTGGLTAANLPNEQTTEVTTNVIVRDGNTILIGGLFREQSQASRRQTPILGNIPGAGVLFRGQADETTREEVIILLTVHLVKDDDPLLEMSLEAIQDVERYRVGMREGLQWWGRERLAQAHYHWALEHLERGDLDRALWDLNLAINNNPKFLAAIKLKEDLLGERVWDEDNSAIRGFVRQQIMKEEGLVLPQFGRPGPPFPTPDLLGPVGHEADDNDFGSEPESLIPHQEHDFDTASPESGEGAS